MLLLVIYYSRTATAITVFFVNVIFIMMDVGNVAGSWTCTFSLWCLNPAVVFRGVADLSLSVILTSG